MSSRAYRVLVRLYPRSFRREFGDEMVRLFEDQRADDGALRAWWRVLVDTAAAAPVQHLEVLVHRRSPRTISSAVAIAGLTTLVAGIAIGSVVSPLLLIVGVVLAVTGVASLQQHRGIVAASVLESWWKVLLTGPALIVILIVAEGIWPPSLEPPGDVAWLLMFSTVILAITLTALGAMLGVVQLVSRLQASRRTTGP